MKEISFQDTKIVKNEKGEREVLIFIPECCREGWESCTHVAKPIRVKKTNVGL